MRDIIRMVVAVLLIITALWTIPVAGIGPGWVAINGVPYSSDYGEIQSRLFNVSRNKSNSKLGYNQSLVLDPKGNPHIVWYDDNLENNEIFYVYWGGKNWMCAGGETYNPETGNANISKSSNQSEYPTLALDEFDNPHISWCEKIDESFDVFYLKWNGENWVNSKDIAYDTKTNNANITNNGKSQYPSLKLDDRGKPHLVWRDSSISGNAEIIYMYQDNHKNWVSVDGAENNLNISRNGGFSYRPKLCLDSQNYPHITWYDYSTQDHEIFYSRWDGKDWVCANGAKIDYWDNSPNVSGNVNWSRYPSLALDSNDNPHITWQESSYKTPNWEILYLHWDGNNWICANGDLQETCGNSARVSDNDFHSRYPSLVLDNENNPHISWSFDSKKLKTVSGYGVSYVHWNGFDWVCVNSENKNSDFCDIFLLAERSFLALDKNNNPNIVWASGIPAKPGIYYARWKNGDEINNKNGCEITLKFQLGNKAYSVNNVEKIPMETSPVIVHDRLFLLIRYVAEEIPGTTIDWIQAEKKVIITTSGGKRIELQIGNKDAAIDGEKVQIDPGNPNVVPFITAGRTHCPMRFVAEQLGATGEDDIKWFPETKTVEIRFDIPDCE